MIALSIFNQKINWVIDWSIPFIWSLHFWLIHTKLINWLIDWLWLLHFWLIHKIFSGLISRFLDCLIVWFFINIYSSFSEWSICWNEWNFDVSLCDSLLELNGERNCFNIVKFKQIQIPFSGPMTSKFAWQFARTALICNTFHKLEIARNLTACPCLITVLKYLYTGFAQLLSIGNIYQSTIYSVWQEVLPCS